MRATSPTISKHAPRMVESRRYSYGELVPRFMLTTSCYLRCISCCNRSYSSRSCSGHAPATLDMAIAREECVAINVGQVVAPGVGHGRPTPCGRRPHSFFLAAVGRMPRACRASPARPACHDLGAKHHSAMRLASCRFDHSTTSARPTRVEAHLHLGRRKPTTPGEHHPPPE